jgi:hypothetical protein
MRQNNTGLAAESVHFNMEKVSEAKRPCPRLQQPAGYDREGRKTLASTALGPYTVFTIESRRQGYQRYMGTTRAFFKSKQKSKRD